MQFFSTLIAPMAFASLLVAIPAGAEPYGEGDRFPPITLKDQHGNPHSIGEGVRAVLFSRDMEGGGVLKDALKKSGAELLKSAGAVYVADVHRMPGLIRRLFALPGLRRRGYPVLIDEDGTATESFPSAEGKATLIELERLRIKRIRHLSTAPELRRALSPKPDGG